MCKLIRKLYTAEEIEDGVADDEPLDKIKSKHVPLTIQPILVDTLGAVAGAYFDENDVDVFEYWWNNEGRISRGGQQRKRRCMSKKKRR